MLKIPFYCFIRLLKEKKSRSLKMINCFFRFLFLFLFFVIVWNEEPSRILLDNETG